MSGDAFEGLRQEYDSGNRWALVHAIRLALIRAPEWLQEAVRDAAVDQGNNRTAHFGERIFPLPRGKEPPPPPAHHVPTCIEFGLFDAIDELRASGLKIKAAVHQVVRWALREQVEKLRVAGMTRADATRKALADAVYPHEPKSLRAKWVEIRSWKVAHAIRDELARSAPRWVQAEFEAACDDHSEMRTKHFGEKIFPRRGRGQSELFDEDLVCLEIGERVILAPRELAFLEAVDLLRVSGLSISAACKDPALAPLSEAFRGYSVEWEALRRKYRKLRRVDHGDDGDDSSDLGPPRWDRPDPVGPKLRFHSQDGTRSIGYPRRDLQPSRTARHNA